MYYPFTTLKGEKTTCYFQIGKIYYKESKPEHHSEWISLNISLKDYIIKNNLVIDTMNTFKNKFFSTTPTKNDIKIKIGLSSPEFTLQESMLTGTC